MKKKLIVLTMLCLLVVLCLTGCSKKTAITSADFEAKAKEKGFVVENLEIPDNEKENLKEGKVAKQSDCTLEICFRVYADSDIANKAYNDAVAAADQAKSSVGTSYTQVASFFPNAYFRLNDPVADRYTVISYIENTLVQVSTSIENKSTVKEFLKEIGY